jgi:uncharacterized membrane protein affecting hemolysin expression
MTAILAILAKLPMWLYILIFAVCIIGVQQWRIHHAHAQVTALQGVANTLHEANQTNVATIATLEAANRKWADDNAANLANAKVYADAAMEYAKQQQAAAESANAKLRAIYAKQPDAKAWADVPVPAGVARVADGMREQAGSTH